MNENIQYNLEKNAQRSLDENAQRSLDEIDDLDINDDEIKEEVKQETDVEKNRKLLKQKIINKKNNRSRGGKTVPKSVELLMKNPEVKEAMDSLNNSGDLDKLIKSIAVKQSGGNMSNADTHQVKKILNSFK